MIRITTLVDEKEVRTTEKIWYVHLLLNLQPNLVLFFLVLLIADVLIAFVQLELPFFYPGQVPLKLLIVPSLFSNLLTVTILTFDKWFNLPHADMLR